MNIIKSGNLLQAKGTTYMIHRVLLNSGNMIDIKTVYDSWFRYPREYMQEVGTTIKGDILWEYVEPVEFTDGEKPPLGRDDFYVQKKEPKEKRVDLEHCKFHDFVDVVLFTSTVRECKKCGALDE